MARKSAMKWNASPGPYCNLLSCKGGCKILYRLYLLFSFYSPDSSMFSDDSFFVREETWIVARFTMEYPPRTQLRFLLFLFTKLALGPILLMMINVSINDD